MRFQIPYTNSSASSAPHTPHHRITKVGLITGTSESALDIEMASPWTVEQKVGDTYPPSVLSNHRGPCFRSLISVCDYLAFPRHRCALIFGCQPASWSRAQACLVKDQKNDRGEPQTDRKVYYRIVDKLKVLDHGDAEPWDLDVPTMPECRAY
ncbi:hypothetical protein B0H14DRAFT_2618938 [Mycena olivaceomarginata]|nr:hypothetical protein B0H14DRAFT_2618938 [Mycena olivaceomarginata]